MKGLRILVGGSQWHHVQFQLHRQILYALPVDLKKLWLSNVLKYWLLNMIIEMSSGTCPNVGFKCVQSYRYILVNNY